MFYYLSSCKRGGRDYALTCMIDSLQAVQSHVYSCFILYIPLVASEMYGNFNLRSTWLYLPLKRALWCATTDCGGILFLTAVKLWGSNVFRSVKWNLSSITHSIDLHWSAVFVFLSRGDAGCLVGCDKFLPKLFQHDQLCEIVLPDDLK